MDREIAPEERRRRTARRLAGGALGVAAAAALFLLLPGWLRPSLARADVRTARVERGPVEAGLTAAGRDTGPGIPPEVQPLLFTPLFSTKRDGRGLSLTLVREILAQHRFAVRLENRPEGGAELRIVF